VVVFKGGKCGFLGCAGRKGGILGQEAGILVFLRFGVAERVFCGEFLGKVKKNLKKIKFFLFFLFADLYFVL